MRSKLELLYAAPTLPLTEPLTFRITNRIARPEPEEWDAVFLEMYDIASLLAFINQDSRLLNSELLQEALQTTKSTMRISRDRKNKIPVQLKKRIWSAVYINFWQWMLMLQGSADLLRSPIRFVVRKDCVQSHQHQIICIVFNPKAM